jgi:hypothetical protein
VKKETKKTGPKPRTEEKFYEMHEIRKKINENQVEGIEKENEKKALEM